MKIWKLQIFWENGTVMKFGKKLSILEMDRITRLLAGGVHVHSNPKRKHKTTPWEIAQSRNCGYATAEPIGLSQTEPKYPYCAPVGGKGD